MNRQYVARTLKLTTIGFLGAFFCIVVLLLKKPETTENEYKSQKDFSEIKKNYKTANPFKIYKVLQKKILSHTLKMKDLNAFHTIIKNEEELQHISQTVTSLCKETSGEEMYKILYRQFIKASSDLDVLYHYLNDELFKVLEKAEKHKERRGSIYAWSWSYGARAAMLAYMASEEKRFLDLVVSTYDIVLENRDSERNKIDEIRGRPLNSWGTSTRQHAKNIWTNVVTTAGMVTYPVSLFCKIVFDNEELHPKYGDSAERYLKSIKLAIAEFNEDFEIIPGNNKGYYRRPTDGRTEPLNHAHTTGNTLIMLYLITGQEKYREKAVQLARFFLSSVRCAKNGSYVWAYQPTHKDRITDKIEPVWKGAITISFPVLAHRHGIEFDTNDMRAIGNTFLKNIYRGNNTFSRDISAGKEFTRLDTVVDSSKGRMRNLVLWIFMDTHDPKIRTIIEDVIVERTDIFEVGWFQSTKTALAYSHRFQPLP